MDWSGKLLMCSSNCYFWAIFQFMKQHRNTKIKFELMHLQFTMTTWHNMHGLVQDCSNFSALAMELLLSCAKQSILILTWHKPVNNNQKDFTHVNYFCSVYVLVMTSLLRNAIPDFASVARKRMKSDIQLIRYQFYPHGYTIKTPHTVITGQLCNKYSFLKIT